MYVCEGAYVCEYTCTIAHVFIYIYMYTYKYEYTLVYFQLNAEKCPYLVERLNITVMPTIIMTADNFVCDKLEGFDELGTGDTHSCAYASTSTNMW